MYGAASAFITRKQAWVEWSGNIPFKYDMSTHPVLMRHGIMKNNCFSRYGATLEPLTSLQENQAARRTSEISTQGSSDPRRNDSTEVEKWSAVFCLCGIGPPAMEKPANQSCEIAVPSPTLIYDRGRVARQNGGTVARPTYITHGGVWRSNIAN